MDNSGDLVRNWRTVFFINTSMYCFNVDRVFQMITLKPISSWVVSEVFLKHWSMFCITYLVDITHRITQAVYHLLSGMEPIFNQIRFALEASLSLPTSVINFVKFKFNEIFEQYFTADGPIQWNNFNLFLLKLSIDFFWPTTSVLPIYYITSYLQPKISLQTPPGSSRKTFPDTSATYHIAHSVGWNLQGIGSNSQTPTFGHAHNPNSYHPYSFNRSYTTPLQTA